MPEQTVIHSIEGPLAVISLNRPEKRNAINGDMLDAIKTIIDDLAMNADVRAILLKGEGPCFAAGIDLAYLMGLSQIEKTQVGTRVRVLANKIQTVMNTVERIEKPVIASIHGFCGGLALELVMACDFRLVRKDAIFGLPEILFGLLADCGGTTRLTRAVGVARAKEILMLGDMFDSATAMRYGLVTRVFEEDDYQKGVDAFVEKILQRPALTLGLAKRLVDLGANVDMMTFMDLEAALQSLCITAHDFPETFQKGMVLINELKNERKKDR